MKWTKFLSNWTHYPGTSTGNGTIEEVGCSTYLWSYLQHYNTILN